MSTSDIKNQQNSNSQNLQKLQEQYRRRREQLIERNEANLRNLKSDFQQKEKKIRTSGAAIVNHIRREANERAESLERQSAERLAKQQEVLARQYENIKSQGERRIRDLDAGLSHKQARISNKITEAKLREEQSIRHEQNKSAQFQKQEAERRKGIQTNTNKYLNEVQSEAKTKETEIRAAHSEEVKKINQKLQQDLEKQGNSYQESFKRQNRTGGDRLQQLKAEHRSRYTEEKGRHNKSLEQMKHTYKEEATKTEAQGKTKLNTVREGNKQAISTEVDRGTGTLEQLRSEYDEEIKQTHQQGEAEVVKQKEKYKSQLKKQDEYYQGKLEQRKKHYEQQLETDETRFQEKKANNEEVYRKQLVNQHQEFNRTYATNQKLNKEALQSQHDLLTREIKNQQVEVMQEYGKYRDIKDDPFYSMNAFETSVWDHPSHYVLKAKVPEHERDNVDVIVKGDKLVVQGNRSFSDSLEEGDRKISTNNFQTFREEVALKQPVHEKKVIESYDKGILTVRIPKII